MFNNNSLVFTWIILHDSVLISVFGIGNGKIGGRIIDSDMHDVGRFLNRILGLTPDIQNRSIT